MTQYLTTFKTEQLFDPSIASFATAIENGDSIMASGGGGNKGEDVVTYPVYRNPLYTSTSRQIDPQDEVQGDPVTSPPRTKAGAQTLFKSTPSVQDPSL